MHQQGEGAAGLLQRLTHRSGTTVLWLAKRVVFLVVVAATAGGVAVATDDDGDVHVTGPEADRATEAALKATPSATDSTARRKSSREPVWAM